MRVKVGDKTGEARHLEMGGLEVIKRFLPDDKLSVWFDDKPGDPELVPAKEVEPA